jgi:regulator of protease activity HflC (stomatin/prohibitin superfamily)
MKKFSSIILAFSILALTLNSCTQITPKEEGFKISNSGDYRGVDSLPLLTGVNFYMPGFSYIVTLPTIMQHKVWSEGSKEGSTDDEAIIINCMGGSGFKVDVGLNYRIKGGKASKVYLKYKSDNIETITDTYLRNIVRGAMQDISGHITVDSILNNLPGYEASVRGSLSERFTKEGFILEGYNILAMPKPVDPNLAAAINKKIIAKQDAETAIQQLQITKAEANKQIAEARGDSASSVTRAAGEAKAYSLKQRELTALLVQQQTIEKWDGKLSVYGSSPSLFKTIKD